MCFLFSLSALSLRNANSYVISHNLRCSTPGNRPLRLLRRQTLCRPPSGRCPCCCCRRAGTLRRASGQRPRLLAARRWSSRRSRCDQFIRFYFLCVHQHLVARIRRRRRRLSTASRWSSRRSSAEGLNMCYVGFSLPDEKRLPDAAHNGALMLCKRRQSCFLGRTH